MKKLTQRALWLIAVITTIGLAVTACETSNDTTPPDPCAKGHDFPEWIAPICEVAGNSERACTRSGCSAADTRTDGFAALEHVMELVDGGNVIEAPTCTQTGLGEMACARGCGHTEEDGVILPRGHKIPPNWTVETAASCTTNGLEKKVCEYDDCDDKADTGTQTQVILPRGHKIPPNWTVETTAGCTTDGLEKKVCEYDDCDDKADTGTQTQVIPAAHRFTEWQETTPATCLDAATDTEKCEVCGELGTKMEPGRDALEHDPGNESGARAATCFEPGYTGGSTICLRCDEPLTAGQPIDQLPHPHYHEWTAPTCTTPGNHERFCVNDCGFKETRDTGYAALGHTGSVAAFAATCTTAGNSVLSGNCVRFAQCGYVVTGTVIAALGHTWGVDIAACNRTPCSTSLPTLVQYIQASPNAGTAAATAVPLKVSINLGTMGTADNGWTQLLAALNTGGKLVNLDLSDSTMTTAANEFNTGNGTSIPAAVNGILRIASIVLPDTATSIGNNAFRNCTGLTSVTIPNSVNLISGYAFQNCTGLTSVIIPNSVNLIGLSAFLGCTGLTSVTLEKWMPDAATSPNDLRITRAGTNPFGSSGPNTALRIVVPVGSVAVYKAAENWSAQANRFHAVGCSNTAVNANCTQCN